MTVTPEQLAARAAVGLTVANENDSKGERTVCYRAENPSYPLTFLLENAGYRVPLRVLVRERQLGRIDRRLREEERQREREAHGL